jgi:hypothetical protein
LYHFAQHIFNDTPEEEQPTDQQQSRRIIKDAYKDAYLIGMAGDLPGRYSEEERSLAAEHFNAITPENCMKPERVHPEENVWRFERPDALVQWADDHKMAIHGHTLVWHAQTGNWFFRDGDKATTPTDLRLQQPAQAGLRGDRRSRAPSGSGSGSSALTNQDSAYRAVCPDRDSTAWQRSDDGSFSRQGVTTDLMIPSTRDNNRLNSTREQCCVLPAISSGVCKPDRSQWCHVRSLAG